MAPKGRETAGRRQQLEGSEGLCRCQVEVEKGGEGSRGWALPSLSGSFLLLFPPPRLSLWIQTQSLFQWPRRCCLSLDGVRVARAGARDEWAGGEDGSSSYRRARDLLASPRESRLIPLVIPTSLRPRADLPFSAQPSFCVPPRLPLLLSAPTRPTRLLPPTLSTLPKPGKRAAGRQAAAPTAAPAPAQERRRSRDPPLPGGGLPWTGSPRGPGCYGDSCLLRLGTSGTRRVTWAARCDTSGVGGSQARLGRHCPLRTPPGPGPTGSAQGGGKQRCGRRGAEAEREQPGPCSRRCFPWSMWDSRQHLPADPPPCVLALWGGRPGGGLCAQNASPGLGRTRAVGGGLDARGHVCSRRP